MCILVTVGIIVAWLNKTNVIYIISCFCFYDTADKFLCSDFFENPGQIKCISAYHSSAASKASYCIISVQY